MREIKPELLDENPFKLIRKDWLLLTAQKDNKVNTMTAAWGGLGVLWEKKVAYLFVRPQRYTKEFIDASERLSISVLPSEYKKQLGYLGSVSGRDEDKIANSGLTVKDFDGVPGFEEARLTIVAKKLYAQELKEACFIDTDIIEKEYKEKDFHTMYVVEIEKIIEK